MADYKRPQIHISGVGVAEPYCYLAVPDYGTGAFKSERGEYKVNITLNNDDPKCAQMISKIDAIHKETYEAGVKAYNESPPKVVKGKKPPLKPYEGDMPYIDNEDGTTTFRFKSWASYTDSKTGQVKDLIPAIVDSRGKKIKGDRPAITTGSELKIKYTMFPYLWSAIAGASVKLQIQSIMVVKLVEFGAGDSEDWGDEVEDGGYVDDGSREETVDTFDEPDDEEKPDDDDDF